MDTWICEVAFVIGMVESKRMPPLKYEYVTMTALLWIGVIVYARGVRSWLRQLPETKHSAQNKAVPLQETERRESLIYLSPAAGSIGHERLSLGPGKSAIPWNRNPSAGSHLARLYGVSKLPRRSRLRFSAIAAEGFLAGLMSSYTSNVTVPVLMS